MIDACVFSRLVIQKLPLTKASIELVGNSDGTLLGCLSEVEEQFRPGNNADVCELRTTSK